MNSFVGPLVGWLVRPSVRWLVTNERFCQYLIYHWLIETKIGVRVDIDKGYHLVKGQGHWVKGQDQIHVLLKKNVLAVDYM